MEDNTAGDGWLTFPNTRLDLESECQVSTVAITVQNELNNGGVCKGPYEILHVVQNCFTSKTLVTTSLQSV